MFSQGVTFLDYSLVWGPQGCFGTSFWEVFGHLGEHFGGFGGSWGQVGIWMDLGILRYSLGSEETCPLEGKLELQGG